MINIKLSVILLALVKNVITQGGTGIDGLPECATMCAETAAQAAQCSLQPLGETCLCASSFVSATLTCASHSCPPEEQPAVRGFLGAICDGPGTTTISIIPSHIGPITTTVSLFPIPVSTSAFSSSVVPSSTLRGTTRSSFFISSSATTLHASSSSFSPLSGFTPIPTPTLPNGSSSLFASPASNDSPPPSPFPSSESLLLSNTSGALLTPNTTLSSSVSSSTAPELVLPSSATPSTVVVTSTSTTLLPSQTLAASTGTGKVRVGAGWLVCVAGIVVGVLGGFK